MTKDEAVEYAKRRAAKSGKPYMIVLSKDYAGTTIDAGFAATSADGGLAQFQGRVVKVADVDAQGNLTWGFQDPTPTVDAETYRLRCRT